MTFLARIRVVTFVMLLLGSMMAASAIAQKIGPDGHQVAAVHVEREIVVERARVLDLVGFGCRVQVNDDVAVIADFNFQRAVSQIAANLRVALEVVRARGIVVILRRETRRHLIGG